MVLTAVLPAVCAAALQWHDRKLELVAKPEQREIAGVFRFVNSGTAPVSILSIQPDCGCLAVKPDKHHYAPGETGEIKAVFNLLGRSGPQAEKLTVTTDDPIEPRVSLMMNVAIPEPVTCTPRLLTWAKGGEPVEQSLVITLTEPRPVVSIEISDRRQQTFILRSEPIEPGRQYRLYIRPITLSDIANAPLRCLIRLEGGAFLAFPVYALVK